MPHVSTDLLDIAYLSGGPEAGEPVLLLHGWPDDATGWAKVTPALEQAGYRWVAPWLRGSGATRFRQPDTIRDGSGVALAQDALDLADRLGWTRFAVVGHDWGGRAAYILAAIARERIRSIASLAIGYSPRGKFVTPSFEQSRRWWYQWFMATDGGAAAVRADPIGFARIQWETWSPRGWFSEEDFSRAAESFHNPDGVNITLNGYRSRWKVETMDARYDALRQTLADTAEIDVPTLMIQGADDYCDPPVESEGQASFFRKGYKRVVLDGVGHFPAREDAERASQAVITQLQSPSPYPI